MATVKCLKSTKLKVKTAQGWQQLRHGEKTNAQDGQGGACVQAVVRIVEYPSGIIESSSQPCSGHPQVVLWAALITWGLFLRVLTRQEPYLARSWQVKHWWR